MMHDSDADLACFGFDIDRHDDDIGRVRHRAAIFRTVQQSVDLIGVTRGTKKSAST